MHSCEKFIADYVNVAHNVFQDFSTHLFFLQLIKTTALYQLIDTITIISNKRSVICKQINGDFRDAKPEKVP